MKNLTYIPCLSLGLLIIALAAPPPARGENLSPGTAIFDTQTAATEPLPGEAFLNKTNWIHLPEEKTDHKFLGDAVIINNRLALVIRQKGKSAEIYAQSANHFTQRIGLSPAVQNTALAISGMVIQENSPESSSVEVVFHSASGNDYSLLLELSLGQPYIHSKPGKNVSKLRMEANSRFAILPDFFTDDIVIDAEQIPVQETELPSDNFLLQLLDQGNSLVMNICKTNEQDMKIQLSGADQKKFIIGTEIAYGKAGEIWTAVLEEPGIWHQHDVALSDAGKIIPLDWKVPYSAIWRVDWRCVGGMTDSWEMVSRLADGTYKKHYWLDKADSTADHWWSDNEKRLRWMTVLGTYIFPCWIDEKEKKAYFQPLEKKVIQFSGPALIYPIDRLNNTPLDQLSIIDLIRSTLGFGPCEYILDLEGQQAEYKGIATCTNRNILDEIYSKKQQKQRVDEVEKALKDVMIFIRHIRNRIEGYVQFGKEIQAYLAEQKPSHPELEKPINELASLVKQIDLQVEKRLDKIKTPEYAQTQLVDKFRTTLLNYEGDDALEKCKKITAALVEIGGNQDELVGEGRMAVKLLRQRASLFQLTQSNMGEIAKTIRERSQQVLRNPAGHEGSRH